MALTTILIPYDGSEQADDLLHLACHDVGTEGRVVALYVTRVPPSLPLDGLPPHMDAAGNDALDRAERVTRRYDGILETHLVRARREADAIVGEAGAIAADAIFLPLARGSVWRRWRRARVAWEVVRRAPCRVLLCYTPALDDLYASNVPDASDAVSGYADEDEWSSWRRAKGVG